MLRFMDWSVVALGGALVLMGLGSRWWERTALRQGKTPDQRMLIFRAWLPLLMGLGMISAKVPGLLRAPHPVVMIMDTLNVVLVVTVLFLTLRAGHRASRAPSPRPLDGQG